MAQMPQTQVPGIYHRRVGDILLTTLEDGFQDAPMASVVNIPQDEAVALMHAAYRPVPRRTPVQCFLIRSAGRIALVDTGCGPAKPTVGKLAGNLAAAGVAPDDIDTILMTHLHPDHFGGLRDAAGQAAYPNATLHLAAEEHAYWHDDRAAAAEPDAARRAAFFTQARLALSAYAGRTETFSGVREIFPGVTTTPLPGHTPGHTGYLIESAGETLLIWGDIVHVQEIQVARPEAGMAVDVQPLQAEDTRRAILERAVRERLTVAGMHLHFPAIAHVARAGEGHVLLPEAWSSASLG
jgi:glyoxylase-like metal-dependent hydrolase (beta-lactamase superfamily II)